MATWIALLRGINVVGRKVVPMKALTSDLERVIGVQATARNWRTVSKLLEMARNAGEH